MAIPTMSLGAITPAVNQAPAFKYGPGPIERNKEVAATKLLETQTQELPKETEINQQNANTNRYRAEIENLNGQANRADLLQKRIDFQHKVVSNMAQTWINEHGDNPTTPEAIQDYETMHGFVSPLLGTDGYPDPKTMDPIKAKQLPGYIGMIAAQANDVKDQIDQKAAKITAQKDEYLARGVKVDVNGKPIIDPITGKPTISEDRYEADLRAQVDRERIAMERDKMGMQIAKAINPLTASSRSTLGLAGNVNMRADRALMLLQTPNPTVEDKSMIVRDLQYLMQGGAPFAEEVKKGMYGSMWEDMNKMVQYVTAKPTELDNPDVLAKLKETILDLKEVDNKVIEDNMGVYGAASMDWAARNPEKWLKMTGAVMKTTQQTTKGQEPPATASIPKNGPTRGTIKNGFRFLGGNPSEKKNWEKVK